MAAVDRWRHATDRCCRVVGSFHQRCRHATDRCHRDSVEGDRYAIGQARDQRRSAAAVGDTGFGCTVHAAERENHRAGRLGTDLLKHPDRVAAKDGCLGAEVSQCEAQLGEDWTCAVVEAGAATRTTSTAAVGETVEEAGSYT